MHFADFLLEELSRTSSQDADAIPQANLNVSPSPHLILNSPPTVFYTYPRYASQIPDQVQTTLLSPGSATRELDSIMQHLLGLEQGLCDSPTTSAPSPLIPKSGQEGEKTERKGVDEGQAKGGKDSVLGTCDNASNKEVKPSKAGASIDDLLGRLASDMEKMGVQTSAKGHCASCGKCIVGKFITALGQVWHPEHFVCLICRVELGTTGYFEREGEAYCQKDYQNLFSPRCGYCKAPILQNILTAMNQSWHPEHFFCAECGEVFGSEGKSQEEPGVALTLKALYPSSCFKIKVPLLKGKPYCCNDFYRLFAPKCSGCGKPVQENYLSAANGTWHPQCFVCAVCRLLQGALMSSVRCPYAGVLHC
uniref:Leupaxin n=1 Tax=Paramormyrops kingsleyae TaxID=1676925 RepID=A0A3B3SZV8_9TELE